MTKSEILQKHINEERPQSIDPVEVFEKMGSVALKSMDEYAKEEAIAYHDWIHRGDLRQIYMTNGDGTVTVVRPSQKKLEEEIITTEELYELFLKSKGTN